MDVTLTFGDVAHHSGCRHAGTDNNRFLIYLTMRVMDVPQNSGGDMLDNIASLTFTNPNTGTTRTITDDPVIDRSDRAGHADHQDF